MLLAGHIKPWKDSTPAERLDLRNGLAACPAHDVASDTGLRTRPPAPRHRRHRHRPAPRPRIFDASRELVYRAFTHPGQLAQWFGPAGCSVPRDSIEIDARPGGHLRFVMTAPDVRGPVDATFTDVVENELLAGEMEAAGVPGPRRVHLRLEFHDVGNGKTRLELRQDPFATGQPGADTGSGWESSFTKLDTLPRAGSREDRVLEDARIGVEREDTGRTGLRARPGPAAEVGRRA